MGEEVWAQLADGTCRWRQTSSQLTIVCLKVQPGTPAKQLQVTLDPYFIKGLLPCLHSSTSAQNDSVCVLAKHTRIPETTTILPAVYLLLKPLGQTWFMAQLCAPIRGFALLIRLQPARV